MPAEVDIASETQEAADNPCLVIVVEVKALGARFVSLAADSAFAVLQVQQAVELANWQPIPFFAVRVGYDCWACLAPASSPQPIGVSPHALLPQPPKKVNQCDCQPELLHVPPPSGTVHPNLANWGNTTL